MNRNIIPKSYINDNALRRIHIYHEDDTRMVHPLYVTQRNIANQNQISHVMNSNRDSYEDKMMKENDLALKKSKQLYKSQIKDVYKKANQNRRSYIESIQEIRNKRKRGMKTVFKNETISNVHRPNKFTSTNVYQASKKFSKLSGF